MTRIGPAAALRTRTPCKCNTGPAAAQKAAILRTRSAMCGFCNGKRAKCPESGQTVLLHLNGKPCPRGLHPDKRNRVTWRGRAWSGVPFPIRLYLYLRKPEADPETWVASFAGCGCVRKWKAAWLRLTRMWR